MKTAQKYRFGRTVLWMGVGLGLLVSGADKVWALNLSTDADLSVSTNADVNLGAGGNSSSGVGAGAGGGLAVSTAASQSRTQPQPQPQPPQYAPQNQAPPNPPPAYYREQAAAYERPADQNPQPQPQDDRALKAQVESQIWADARLMGLPIQVRVDRANVTLNGKVRTQAQKILAGSIARAAAGVRSVSNRLSIDAKLKIRLKGESLLR